MGMTTPWQRLPSDIQLAVLSTDVINGCGTPSIEVPDLGFWEACAAHDYAYWLGGRPHHRLGVDGRFFADMLRASRCPRDVGVAIVYFLAVVLGGSRAWVRRPRPLGLRGVIRGLLVINPSILSMLSDSRWLKDFRTSCHNRD